MQAKRTLAAAALAALMSVGAASAHGGHGKKSVARLFDAAKPAESGGDGTLREWRRIGPFGGWRPGTVRRGHFEWRLVNGRWEYIWVPW